MNKYIRSIVLKIHRNKFVADKTRTEQKGA